MKKKHKRRLATTERIVVELSARIARLEDAAGIQSDAPMAGSFQVQQVAIDHLNEMIRGAAEAARSVKVPPVFVTLDHAMKRAADKAEAP